MPGRNHNYRLSSGAHQRYFLKQAPRGEAGDGPLATEAALYRWAEADPAAAALRPFLPRWRHWDAERSILVLDQVAAADATRVPLAHLAEALAACHRLTVAGTTLELRLPRTAPWIFDLARPLPAMLRELSPAQLAVIRAVQESPGAADALARLGQGWRTSCLIHGDIKWQNVMALSDGGLILVDWEMAQIGDPAWDVAGALQAGISEAVLTLDLPEGLPAADAARLLGPTVSALRPAHREFLTHYVAAALLAPGESRALSERLPSHVAARLIKTAFEWGQAEPRIPRRAVAALQLGINLLRRPREGGELVLGVPTLEPSRL